MNQVKTYYTLTKPGIIYGNLLTTVAGFLLASKGRVNFWLFLATLFGVALVIASGCVFNNYLDRDIDKIMTRTKKRALASGLISTRNAIVYGLFLALLGFFILAKYTNLLTVLVGLIGFFFYVVVYGLTKRSSVHGTLVGSISGAAPIVAGYTAVTNRFDTGGLILFLILAFWQMPHFYAIAIYRFNDYKAANLPVLPVEKGIKITKLQILFYMVAFLTASLSLTFFGYTGKTYLVITSVLGLVWLWFGLKGFKTKNDGPWARKVFFISLIVLLLLSVMLSLGAVLP